MCQSGHAPPPPAKHPAGASGPDALRVCLLIPWYPPRFTGHGIQIERSLPDLEAHGVELTVLTHPLPGVVEEERIGRRSRVLRTLPLGSVGGGLGQLRALREHFRRHGARYDVVHSVSKSWQFVASLGLLRRMGLPVVVELILFGLDDLDALRRSRLGAVRVRLLRRVDAWVGISDVFRPTLVRAGIPEERFRVIPTGVDTERFRPRDPAQRAALRDRLGLPRDARILVSAGSVIPRKGMDRVIRGFLQMPPEPGRDLLVIAGPNRPEHGFRAFDPAHVEAIEALSRQAPPGTLRFAGRVDNLEDYFGAADAFVFLSRHEGLGNVIIEAMASGLPCIVSPLDGIAEHLLDGSRCGAVVSCPDDPDAVASVLRELGSDPARAGHLGRRGRERALELFSMRTRAAVWADLYRGLSRARDARSGSRDA